MTGRSRRRFLAALGTLSTGVIAGCSSDTEATTPVLTDTRTATQTEQGTEEVTEEPVELPRVIDGSEVPSFDTVYTPDEWAPSNYDSVIADVDVAGIESEYGTRKAQMQQVLVEVMSAEEYSDFESEPLNAGLNAIYELSWADPDTVVADEITVASGAMGGMLEIIYEDESGNLHHDAMNNGSTDTRTSDYMEDLPNSDFHDGNTGDWTWTEFEAIETVIENSGGPEEVTGNSSAISGISNIAFGPNDEYNLGSDMEPVVVGRDYLQTMSQAIENDTQEYLDMKKELSQYLGAVDEGNALGASIQDGQRLYEELDSETFDGVAPFQYNWG